MGRSQSVICLMSFQFLTEHGYPGTLSSKTLQSPSTKEFVKMFEFIYRQLDPTFEMPDSKVEEEVPALLRALRWNILVLSTVHTIVHITQDLCLHICTIQYMKALLILFMVSGIHLFSRRVRCILLELPIPGLRLWVLSCGWLITSRWEAISSGSSFFFFFLNLKAGWFAMDMEWTN